MSHSTRLSKKSKTTTSSFHYTILHCRIQMQAVLLSSSLSGPGAMVHRALHGLLLLMLLQLAAPVQAAGPQFSWDTLPVFIQLGNNTGPFNDAAIDVLAKFDMVVLDKWQGPCGQQPSATPACDEEGVMLAEARRIKRANPNVSTLLYWNSILDFPQYTLHAKMLAHPELMLHDNSNGEIVRLDGGGHVGMDVFDFANPAARELFTSECVTATQSGVVDGCYLDRATGISPVVNLSAVQAKEYEDGHNTMLTDLQAREIRSEFGRLPPPPRGMNECIDKRQERRCKERNSRLLEVVNHSLGGLPDGVIARL
jgi:hypothetical protein